MPFTQPFSGNASLSVNHAMYLIGSPTLRRISWCHGTPFTRPFGLYITLLEYK